MSLSSVSQIIRARTGRRRSAQRGMDSSLSSKDRNSIQSYRHRYDVFISFRGPDTRNSFVDHLYAHLVRKGLFVFKDDKQLQKGEFISLQLQRAIQSSRVSIVVFSKDYASSTWCLDEMSTIADCFRSLGQIVFPVFYGVEPTHVRNQDGAYEHTFVSRNRSTRRRRFRCLLPRNWMSSRLRYIDRRIFRWTQDMTSLAGLAGWNIMNKPEFPEIENIVQAVIEKLGHRLLGSVDDLIKIQPQVEALEKHLKLSSDNDGFRVLGIWGMDGIGKTTLATVLFDTISRDYEFDACCFIRDVHKIYRDGGPISLQKHILHQSLKELNLDVYNSSEIYGIITNRLYNRKLLLVLDDVDQFEQLQKLHINPKLLCPGSRIIITTRDVHILKLYGADEIYKVEWMNDNDARELLCRKAFKNDDPSNDYQELIPKVLEYAQGLPLAISIMGSFLYNRNTSQWRATLEGWENNPNRGIMEVFQSSFEGLEQREREIFLHVACFFDGEREDYVRQIVDACGLQPDIGISLLVEKSFITIRNEEIHMHKMLQELGKKNVRREDTNNPYLWSRLWVYDDFHLALMPKRRTLEVKAIVLDQREDDDVEFNQLQLNAHYLSKLEFLELLILRHKNVSGRLESLSNALRYFSWIGYPFTYLPSNFQPHYLAYVNMSESNIEQLWTGFQYLPYLKRMDLSNCKNLRMTPRFDGMQNLERLDFTGCTNLLEVHQSIGHLEKLVFLSLQNCGSLVSLNFSSKPRLRSLRVLRLFGCTKLENLLDFTGALILEYLDMDQCKGLTTIHESIGTLAKLKFLSLRECTNLVTIPDCLMGMTSLVTLDLRSCLNLRNLPINSPPISLIDLDLSFCNLSEVPDSIGELRFLERLNLQGNRFITIPSTIKGLSNLSYLNLSHCHRLHDLPDLRPKTGTSNSAGEYFKTTSGSRDHRSGLYFFDCPGMASFSVQSFFPSIQLTWLGRLVKEPRLYRSGFDFVFPWHGKKVQFPKWFNHQFKGGSVIRIKQPEIPFNWTGFVFCVEFEVNNSSSAASGSSSHQSILSPPNPFYLSFENEYTEERFDMSLNLELNKVDSSSYLWMIYISREHCHFAYTGAQITFKARHGLIIKEWGFHELTNKDIEGSGSSGLRVPTDNAFSAEVIDDVTESSSSFESKIQLPYNWSLSKEDEVEHQTVKRKENNLSNLGFYRRVL